MALVTVAQLKAALGIGSLYSDAVLEQIIEAAETLLGEYCDASAITAEPAPLKEAALSLSIDLFQAQRSAGGQIVASDFQPSPYRLGRSFVAKVSGLLAPYLKAEGMVG
jgi:hypothetical protein